MEDFVMKTWLNRVAGFANDESGQDLLEYALLVALIALVAFGAVQLAGKNVSTIFGNIAGQLTGA
jgi:pilus assembly protein Flp/PilA